MFDLSYCPFCLIFKYTLWGERVSVIGILNEITLFLFHTEPGISLFSSKTLLLSQENATRIIINKRKCLQFFCIIIWSVIPSVSIIFSSVLIFVICFSLFGVMKINPNLFSSNIIFSYFIPYLSTIEAVGLFLGILGVIMADILGISLLDVFKKAFPNKKIRAINDNKYFDTYIKQKYILPQLNNQKYK